MTRDEYNKQIEGLFEDPKFNATQMRFFRPDRFSKMTGRLYEFENTCGTCKDLLSEGHDIIERLAEEEPVSEQLSIDYNDVFKKMIDHLKRDHQLLLPNYYSSVFTMVGLVAGILLWWFISVLVINVEELFIGNKMMFLISGFIGLSLGRITGAGKDRKIKEDKLRIY